MRYMRRRKGTNNKGAAIAASALAVAAVLILVISAVQRYFSAASSPFLSGYTPIDGFQNIYLLIALLFCMFSVAVVARGLLKGMPVRFTSPADVMACRAKFVMAACLLLLLASFLSAQDKLSNGNSPEGKAKNYFRFAAEYRSLVTHLPLGLSDAEKETIDDSLGRNITQGSFALNNVTVKYGSIKQIRDIARTVRTGEWTAWTTGKGRAVAIIKTPAAVAFEKATTWTFSLMLLTCAALALYALTCAVKLLALGHGLWLSFTDGKRNVMKILNLLYYLGYVPMVVAFGFVCSFRKMPSFHGSPGSFARAQSIIRAAVSASLFACAALVVAEAFAPWPPAQYGYVQFIAVAAVLSLAIAAVRALVWARKARKGYVAEKKVAIDLTEACLRSQKLVTCLKAGASVDIYWGRKYGYIPGKARNDIASRVAMFLKRVFGKEEKDTADIDLSIKYTMPGDIVLWLVCEIKSYYVGDICWTKPQAVGNANVVRSEETKGGNGPIVVPVVISTEWTNGPGSKEHYVARLCDDAARMTVRGLLETGLDRTATARYRCEWDRETDAIETINL